MLRFFYDMGGIILLRFRDKDYYRYPFLTLLVAFLVLSMANAALFAPYLPTAKSVTVALVMSITLLKWLCLALTMQVFLHYQGAPKMNLIGFILLSECLNIPMLLMNYSTSLVLLGMFWQFWALWVQLKGLLFFSKLNGLWIILAYVLYFLFATIISIPVLGIFISGGWLDANEVLEHMKKMQEMAR